MLISSTLTYSRLYVADSLQRSNDLRALSITQSLQLASPSSFQRRYFMKILMILTSHDQLGNTGKKTGFWLEEFVAPYYVFKDAGAQITVASPHGGQPPLDPKSDEPSAQTDA